MRYTLLYTMLLCTITSVAQPYKDITSDWCKMGLKGKVKEMSISTYDSNNVNNNNYEKHSYLFNKDGFIKRTTYTVYKNGVAETFISIAHNAPTKVDERSFIITEVQKPEDTTIWNSIVANHPKDTLWNTTKYTIVDDTLYIVGQIPPQGKTVDLIAWVHLNKQQQVLSKDIYYLNNWGDTINHQLQSFTYNREGQRTVDTIRTLKEGKEEQTIMIYEIKKSDNKNNPILETLYESGIEESVGTRKATYTYYE
ncbi:MAG: hypothetical protein R2800_08115 [Flavipsychrobacter sp.]